VVCDHKSPRDPSITTAGGGSKNRGPFPPSPSRSEGPRGNYNGQAGSFKLCVPCGFPSPGTSTADSRPSPIIPQAGQVLWNKLPFPAKCHPGIFLLQIPSPRWSGTINSPEIHLLQQQAEARKTEALFPLPYAKQPVRGEITTAMAEP